MFRNIFLLTLICLTSCKPGSPSINPNATVKFIPHYTPEDSFELSPRDAEVIREIASRLTQGTSNTNVSAIQPVPALEHGTFAIGKTQYKWHKEHMEVRAPRSKTYLITADPRLGEAYKALCATGIEQDFSRQLSKEQWMAIISKLSAK